MLFGTASSSGLYYYLVPHDLNWNVSRVMLILHIFSGTLTFLALTPFVVFHQKDQEGRSLFLLMPWLTFRRRKDEHPRKYRQRLLGHALNGSFLALTLSGFFVALPGILWYAGVVWMPEFLAYQIANSIHLGFTFIVVGLLALHLRARRSANGRSR
ncbi:MAG: hypothetical protein L6Q98_14720 [Anaerolineae bacterium]|nr:hypothetical protein [Anaerolineae bacterium]NUQ04055.1 hypothetical protein [Anaerolineae bacterium]